MVAEGERFDTGCYRGARVGRVFVGSTDGARYSGLTSSCKVWSSSAALRSIMILPGPFHSRHRSPIATWGESSLRVTTFVGAKEHPGAWSASNSQASSDLLACSADNRCRSTPPEGVLARYLNFSCIWYTTLRCNMAGDIGRHHGTAQIKPSSVAF